MKIQVNKDKLVELVSILATIAQEKTTVPILSGILFETLDSNKLRLTASDLNIGAVSECETIAIEEPGSLVLPGKFLLNILKTLRADVVHITTKDTNAHITCGDAKCKIQGFIAEDFPALPKEENLTLHQIDGNALSQLIAKTSYACSHDEARYVLNGAYFYTPTKDTMMMVATDGHRLSFASAPSGASEAFLAKGAIIPLRSLGLLRKTISTASVATLIGFTPNNIFVKNGSTSIIIRPIDGMFPEYKEIIPKEESFSVVMSFNKQKLIQEISFIKASLENKNEAVKISTESDTCLKMESSSEGIEANAECPCEYIQRSSDPIKSGFNTSYIIEALGVLTSDTVLLKIIDDASPAVITTPEQEVLSIIMPMRI